MSKHLTFKNFVHEFKMSEKLDIDKSYDIDNYLKVKEFCENIENGKKTSLFLEFKGEELFAYFTHLVKISSRNSHFKHLNWISNNVSFQYLHEMCSKYDFLRLEGFKIRFSDGKYHYEFNL